MEPLDDHELNELAPAWKAPGAPEHLHRRVFGARRRSWWAWLLTGGIRVPVPACAAIVLLVAWLAFERQPDVDLRGVGASEPANVALPVPPTADQSVVTLADFQPPAEIQVKVVGALP